MTALDARTALQAPDLLAAYNRAEVLTAADVHVAVRLARLAQETRPEVQLAVALAVRSVRAGSVCVRLDDPELLAVAEADEAAEPQALPPAPQPEQWLQAVRASPLVACGVDGPADRPVREVGGRLYLDRYWRDEQVVRTEVDARLGAGPLPVDDQALRAQLRQLFPGEGDSAVRLAAAVAAISRLTVLTGGPGTGKTTTVAKVLALLQHLAGPGVRIALAAPTGKAAARLQEAVRSGIRQLSEQHSSALTAPDATTLHRLLGPLPATATRFRHDRQRHLPFDVVVLDETSMVSLPMMARLLEALRPNARLVLVGDPDQLASVEAGAVLGDLVARAPVASWLPAVLDPLLPGDLPSGSEAVDALRNGVVRLTQVHRHGAEIGSLAEAIRTGDTDAVLGRLRAGDPAIGWYDTEGERPDVAALAALREDAEAAGLAMTAAAESGDAAAALRALDQHRVLVAHRRGRAGVTRWASQVEGWVAAATDRADGGRWYPGRPLLVTANDRDVGLYNGDTGVVIREPGGALVAAFGETEHPRAVRLHRVPSAEAVYAMTVHRGQGSAFDAVSVVLPPASSPLLARELLYTAVTRARSRVRIVGSEAAVRRAVTRPVRRASGLRDALG